MLFQCHTGVLVSWDFAASMALLMKIMSGLCVNADMQARTKCFRHKSDKVLSEGYGGVCTPGNMFAEFHRQSEGNWCASC